MTKDGAVTVRVRESRAHYAGIQTCGSIWVCPVCSAKIRNGKANQVATVTADWLVQGGEVYALTLTMRHHRGQPLKDTFDAMSAGIRHLQQGSPWLKVCDACDVFGTISSREQTHGRNGWHPHIHTLIYVNKPLDDEQLDQLKDYLNERWHKFLAKRGYDASDERGVWVEKVIRAKEAGEYITKTQDSEKSPGNELARADMKSGSSYGEHAHRTPFQILRDIRDADPDDEAQAEQRRRDLALWYEYEKATRNRRAITPSKNMRPLLKEVDKRTEEEMAAEEVGGDDVAVLDRASWYQVCIRPGVHTEVLEAAERGGLSAINAVLGSYDIPLARAPEGEDEEDTAVVGDPKVTKATMRACQAGQQRMTSERLARLYPV